MTATAVVATYLLDLVEVYGTATPIDLPVSRRGIAEHLDLSVEMVCRVLSQFAEAKLIAIPNISQIEIANVAALKALNAGWPLSTSRG